MLKAMSFVEVTKPLINALDFMLMSLCGAFAIYALRRRFEWPFVFVSIACFSGAFLSLVFCLFDLQTVWEVPQFIPPALWRGLTVFNGFLYPLQVILFPTAIILLIRRFLYVVPPPLPKQPSA